MPQVTDQAAAELMWKNLKAQAIGIAKLRGLAPGKQEMTSDEEDTIYMQQADGWTVEQELGLLLEGKSREEIGNLKYPKRMKLAATGERALSKLRQAQFLAKLAQRNDPTWTPYPPKKPPEPVIDGGMTAMPMTEPMAEEGGY